MKLMRFIFSFFLVVTVSLGAQTSFAAGRPGEIPRELPSKSTKIKPERPSVRSSYEAVVVKSPSQAALNAAIEKSKSDLEQVNIVSRQTIPAPEGDLSELLPAKQVSPAKTTPTTKPATKPTSARLQPTTIISTPTVVDSVEVITALPVVDSDLVVGPRQPKINDSPSTGINGQTSSEVEPVIEEASSRYTPPAAIAEALSTSDFEFSQSATAKSTMPKMKEMTTTAFIPEAVMPSRKNSTIAIFRAGYLKSHSSDFDARMKDGATSIGFGAARGIITELGLFEARASIDIYHALDQSISIETVRMVSTRTEATYWFTDGRVKPGLSFALGWAEYSVRTYHHIEGASPSEHTVRTHAQSQAFTVIPGTALRVALGEGLMVDVQTEYLALLGGDSGSQIQGLGANLGLGWLF